MNTQWAQALEEKRARLSSQREQATRPLIFEWRSHTLPFSLRGCLSVFARPTNTSRCNLPSSLFFYRHVESGTRNIHSCTEVAGGRRRQTPTPTRMRPTTRGANHLFPPTPPVKPSRKDTPQHTDGTILCGHESDDHTHTHTRDSGESCFTLAVERVATLMHRHASHQRSQNARTEERRPTWNPASFSLCFF